MSKAPLPAATHKSGADLESQHRALNVQRKLLVPVKILTALFVVAGILLISCSLGVYYHRLFTAHRLRIFSGQARIHGSVSFIQNFEVDVDGQAYEKIDVIDFFHGCNRRFIHDFVSNTTGIVDTLNKRCFVMPLNRSIILPPKSLCDVILKLHRNHNIYVPDGNLLRKTMQVILPPVHYLDDFGDYIAYECHQYSTYRLVPVDSDIVKRSADKHYQEMDIVHYAGKDVISFHFVAEQPSF